MITCSVSLSFVIMFMCMLCYCYNKSIDETSMNVYRRHLMEAANNQNMDIYTVEQFYESEAYAPLCETQSSQTVLPPSYEDAIAAKKYGNRCCDYSHSNRSRTEQTTSDNMDMESKITERTIYDDNGNEMIPLQCSSAHYFSAAESCGSSSNCRMQNECCCTDNCTNNCALNDIECANQSMSKHNNNNNNDDTTSNSSVAGVNNRDNIAAQVQNDNNSFNNVQSRTNTDLGAELNVLSDNGIIRMDMSKCIDQTGLPTYDAAMKLESFGYV